MKSRKFLTATLAAVAIAAVPMTSALAQGTATSSDVQCFGTNSCKGTGSCKSAANDCKGKNSCKAKGYVMMSADACTKAGGSTSAPAAQ